MVEFRIIVFFLEDGRGSKNEVKYLLIFFSINKTLHDRFEGQVQGYISRTNSQEYSAKVSHKNLHGTCYHYNRFRSILLLWEELSHLASPRSYLISSTPSRMSEVLSDASYEI